MAARLTLARPLAPSNSTSSALSSRSLLACVIALPLALAATFAGADEGMWTFDNFPASRVKQKYNVTIDRAWLDRVRAGTGRLRTCSASIVSPNGLILTNYHCVIQCVQDLSNAATDYLSTGFSAAPTEERRCPGQTLDILRSITDVTAKVKAAGVGKAGKQLVGSLNATSAAIESTRCSSKTGLRCQVVSLYGGGEYKLYIFRHFEDLRLVFAPEFKTGFFGGDPDNSNFPRFNLDIGLMRVYENGKPISTPQHLRWNSAPPHPGEPVFLVGDPGITRRMLTVAELETQRDLVLPFTTILASEERGRLIRFAEESPQHARIAQQALNEIENNFKVSNGHLKALADRGLLQDKRAEEIDLKTKAMSDPKLKSVIGDPWGEIAAIQAAYYDLFPSYSALEADAGARSLLFRWARSIVRSAEEREKPSADRLPEYADSRLAQAQHIVLSDTSIQPAIEQLKMEFWLSKARESLTVDNPVTALLLGKDSPEESAQRLVAGTQLTDPVFRRALWVGGQKAVQTSQDPLIRFVLTIDRAAREVRAEMEARVDGPRASAARRIAQVRFAIYGESLYPDATFTPRISFGAIEAWVERGHPTAPVTTFAGLYGRATGQPPFDLPDSWLMAKDNLNPLTPFDFVSTLDVIGGNSGSPTLNAKGEVIGAVFDGNIHSLGGDFGYDPGLNRCISVSAAAIQEALLKVYHRPDLVRELND